MTTSSTDSLVSELKLYIFYYNGALSSYYLSLFLVTT